APNRRSKGQHYTPRRLAELVVAQALEPLVYSAASGLAPGARVLRTPREILDLKVCDIACGTGALLLEAGRYLAARLVEAFEQHDTEPAPSAAEARGLVVRHCLRGVDQDPVAADVACWSLRLWASVDDAAADTGEPSIRCGDALVGSERPGLDESRPEYEGLASKALHWPEEFPEVFVNRQGFDAIIGNPPWGQKRTADDAARKRFIRQHYPSSAGIYDLFRPFVERAVRLLRPGGSLGLVLPDIVLLKDYPQTRKHLLDQLRILSIEWHGQAFRDAMIDTVTLVGIKGTSDTEHAIDAAIHEPHGTRRRRIRQSLFLREPKYTFNLGMSEKKRITLDRLATLPCLGDYFEIHEGVHSGNIRRELFCDAKHDESCCEMYFGGDEISPYLLRWGGRYIRLDAMPEAKAAGRYAHLGRPEWFEQPKVLVRRTGDYVLAAADFSGRYASNNFFLVLPSHPCPLGLPGLASILNSRLTTSFFRAIEPRVGRAFAELKIKHLRRFPLPAAVLGGSAEAIDTCRQLDALGQERARLATAAGPALRDEHQRLDAQIDAFVESLLATTPGDFDD
ncbi:MAG: N-6 DNA methylase, partial [Thermoguttaceae bacterium]|nr:N-6 DNA methylase [Thermoguttaceae bacterium]